MKLSGRLLPLDVENEQNTKETPSSHDQYHLTKQETEDLVGFGALSSVTDSEHNVRRTFSTEKRLYGKTSVLKSSSLDSGAVVSSVVKISCGDKTQIGRISRFLKLHDLLSGRESEFVTVKLYKSCKQDVESLLYYVDTKLFDMKDCFTQLPFFPICNSCD